MLIAANWKMYKGPRETREFLDRFAPPDGVDVVICPPYPSLRVAVESGRAVYAQNVHWEAGGAYTGEGSLDAQTLRGKAPAGVAAAARAAGAPVVAVAGRNLLGPDELAAAGILAAYTLADLEPDPARSMAMAGPLLERVARRLARDWLTGPVRSAGRDPSGGGPSSRRSGG